MAENEELVKSLQFANQEIENLKSAIDSCCLKNAEFERRLSKAEQENKDIREYVEELEDYLLTLDTATRKRNFVITGLTDSGDDSSDALILQVYNFLQPFVDTIDISDFDCAFRLGKSGQSRPILCKMVKESIRNDICSVRNSLNDEDSDTKIYLNDDLPQLIIERKSLFRMVVRLAKNQKIPASSTNTKITVNNITYSHKNLDCLPEGCRLEDAKIIKVKGGLAFQSEHAWLSNFFPCKIEIDGERFVSAEQAYQFTKASRLGDPNLATMISRTKKPSRAKKLGGGLEHHPDWDAQKIDVMRTIMEEKFMQNPYLWIVDSYWAAKATLNSKSLKNGTWQGANFMGKILMEIRSDLRRELGLPTEPTEPVEQMMVTEQPNAPQPEASQPPPPTNAEGGSAVSNAATNTTYQTYAEKSTPRQKKNQTHKSNQNRNPGRGKKNKEHQSPVLSPGANRNQNYTNQQKKVRVFSPQSSLPPKKPRSGNLFAAPDTKEQTQTE